MSDTPGFPLSFAAPLLPELKLPAGPFEAGGEWHARYRTHCLVGNVTMPNGSVRISRTISGSDALLRVRCERRVGPNRLHTIYGEVLCAADQPATPRRWTCAAESPAAHGAVLRSSHSGAGLKAGEIVSHEWSLLDAIQRLPPGDFRKMSFRLLTYDGRLLPDHTLEYRGALDLPVAGKAVRLHGYEHLGAGILPWIYYRAESGRLLVAVSGLQAWVYEGDNA